jgi:hypothetical protein
VIQVDDLQVKDNLIIETVPLRIEEREVKRLRGKEIVMVKVIWKDLRKKPYLGSLRVE